MMSDVASDILTLELHASTKLVNLLLIRALRPAYPLGKLGRMELLPKISRIYDQIVYVAVDFHG